MYNNVNYTEMNHYDTHYDVLGVPHFSSIEVCQHAWKTKSFTQHPDLISDETEKQKQADILRNLNKAWFILGDVHRKREYDNQLRERFSEPKVDTLPKKKWTIWNIIVAILAGIVILRFSFWVLKFILHLIFGYEPY